MEEEPFSDFILEKDLNLGQEVKEHEHQIIYCLTKSDWTCNNCHKNYGSSQPTHFCSLCDYNMCDECIKKGGYERKISFPKIIIPPNESVKSKYINSNYHEHRLVYCRHIYSFLKSTGWECNKCKKYNEKEIWSFYCTKCNLDFCFDCICEQIQ